MLLLLTACGDISSSSDNPTVGDSSARLACRDFYDVAGEADLLNDAELRERIQGIWDYAEISETPGIASAARDILQTVTDGDIDGFEVAVGNMQSACEPVEPL